MSTAAQPKVSRTYLVKGLVRRSLLAFCQLVEPSFQVPRHVADLIQKLERVALGALNRGDLSLLNDIITHLQVFMPPQNGKSTLTSKLFIAWLMGLNPKLRIAFATYNAEFAEKRGRAILAIMESPKYRAVFPGTVLSRTAAAHFETDVGGYVRCTGIDGGLNGYDIDGIIIDDPYNGPTGPQGADSKAWRETVWSWYQETISVRVKPGDFCIIVNTRWHIDDLSGLTLREEAYHNWVVCKYQAINERGEALWPEKFPLKWLQNMRAGMTARKWAALFQQEPVPADGALFSMSAPPRFDRFSVPAKFDRIVQSIDSAQKIQEANDPTVIETWGVLGKRAWLLQVLRKRMTYPELKETVITHAATWADSTQWDYDYGPADLVLIEDKSSGTSLIQDLKVSNRMPCPVIGVEPEGSKEMRALNITDIWESGSVLLPEAAPWLADFESEVGCFPTVSHDDQVDAMSQFLDWLKARIQKGRVAGVSEARDTGGPLYVLPSRSVAQSSSRPVVRLEDL